MKNLLLTGLPGVGKTTAVVRIAESLREFHPTGFYTREMREQGVRQGFELVSFDGRKSILSHVKIKSTFRVGSYGVDLQSFEAFLDATGLSGARLVIIDEIGKMECYSEKFKDLVRSLLDSPVPVIATIALHGGGFIAEVKARGDVRVYELTRENRDRLPEEIMLHLKTALYRQ